MTNIINTTLIKLIKLVNKSMTSIGDNTNKSKRYHRQISQRILRAQQTIHPGPIIIPANLHVRTRPDTKLNLNTQPRVLSSLSGLHPRNLIPAPIHQRPSPAPLTYTHVYSTNPAVHAINIRLSVIYIQARAVRLSA